MTTEKQLNQLKRRKEFSEYRCNIVDNQSGLYDTEKYKDEKRYLLGEIPRLSNFVTTMDSVIRKAIDEACRGRDFSDLDKAAKATIGSIGEGYIRDAFGLPSAEKTHKIDTVIGRVPIDVKFTSQNYGWQFPREVFQNNQWCFLVMFNIKKNIYSCGVYSPLMQHMRNVPNSDKKWSMSIGGKAGKKNKEEISWLFFERNIPSSQYVDKDERILELELENKMLKTRIRELECGI